MPEPRNLAHAIRRTARDNPARSEVADDPQLLGNADRITVPAGDTAKFPQAGVIIEFDDGSIERAEVTAVDEAASQILVNRAVDGTEAVNHNLGTVLLLRPRFSYSEILEAIDFVIDLELWPHVWVPGETRIPYVSGTSIFEPDVSDIGELVYVYQTYSGQVFEVNATWLSPTFGGNVDFPNGAVLATYLPDNSDLFASYRVIPNLANLDASLERLTILGVLAHLTLMEESSTVGPDISVIDRKLQTGSRLRAGAVLWDRFEKARAQRRIALETQEQARRRQLFLARAT